MQYTSSSPISVVVGTGAPEFANIPDASGHGTGIASIVAAIGNNAGTNDGGDALDTAGVMWGGVSSSSAAAAVAAAWRLHARSGPTTAT